MTKLFSLCGCLLLLVLVILPATVQAQPNICGFYGFVTLNGSSVPDGTVVKAWINLTQVRSATTVDSKYNMYVVGDYSGKVVTFTVGDDEFVAAQTGVWAAGENKTLNLNASSSTVPPPPNATLQLNPQEGIITTVTGTGFVPTFLVELKWEGQPVSTVPNPVIVNSTGGFSAIINAPTAMPGEYVISASDHAGSIATTSFTVVSLKGDAGNPGIAGEPGPTGPTGLTGPAGSTGEKGDEGGSGALIIAMIALVISVIVAVLWVFDKNKRSRQFENQSETV